MRSISTNIGNKPVSLVFGLSEISTGSYARRPTNFGGGKVASGIQALIDRFTITLFNQAGSTKHDESFGTRLIEETIIGSSMNFGYVQSAVAIAVERAASIIRNEDSSNPDTAALPLSERLKSAVCNSVEYNTKTGTIKMYVSLTSQAGEDYIYTLPVDLALLQ